MIESRGYPAFNAFPVAGPAYGPPRPTGEARFVRVLLVGSGFSARVQISNATDNGAAPGPLFVPPDNSFQTVATLSQASPPFDYPGPARWVRVLLDSGTLESGSIEEDTRARGISKDDVLAVVREEQPKYTRAVTSIQVGEETVTGVIYLMSGATPDPDPDPTPIPTPTPITRHTLTVGLAGVDSAPVSIVYDQTNVPIYVGPMGSTGVMALADKGSKIRVFGGSVDGYTPDPVRVVTLDSDTKITVTYTANPVEGEEPPPPPPPATYTLTVLLAGQETAPVTITNTTVEPDLLVHQGPLTSPKPFANLTGNDTFQLVPGPVRGFAPEAPRPVLLDADKEVTLTYTARPPVSLTINLNGTTSGVATVTNGTTGAVLTNGANGPGAETIRSGHRIDAGNPNGDVLWGDTLSIEFGAVGGFRTPPVQVVTLEGDVAITAPYEALPTPTKLLQIALSGPDSAPVTVVNESDSNRTLFGSTMTKAQGLSFNITQGHTVRITAANVSGYAPPNPNPRVVVMNDDTSTVLSYTLQMPDARGGTGVFDPAHPLPVSDALTTPPAGTPRFTASTAATVTERDSQNQATFANIRSALLSGQDVIMANNAVWDTKKRLDWSNLPGSRRVWGEGSGANQTEIRARAGYTRTPNSMQDDGLVMMDFSAIEVQGIRLNVNASETGIVGQQDTGWYSYRPKLTVLRNCPVIGSLHTHSSKFRGQSYTSPSGPVHYVGNHDVSYSGPSLEWILSPRLVAGSLTSNGWADQASGGSGGIGPLFTGCTDPCLHTYRLFDIGNTATKQEGCKALTPGGASCWFENILVDGFGKDGIKCDTRSITGSHSADNAYNENVIVRAVTVRNKHGYAWDGSAYILLHNTRGGVVEDFICEKLDTISPVQNSGQDNKGVKLTNNDDQAKNVIVRKGRITGVYMSISVEGHLDPVFEDIEVDQTYNYYALYADARCHVRRMYSTKRGDKSYTALRLTSGSTVESLVAVNWDYAVANIADITANRVTAVSPKTGIFSNPGGVTGSNNVTATTAPPSPVLA